LGLGICKAKNACLFFIIQRNVQKPGFIAGTLQLKGIKFLLSQKSMEF
jgi:hypothetical protein